MTKLEKFTYIFFIISILLYENQSKIPIPSLLSKKLLSDLTVFQAPVTRTKKDENPFFKFFCNFNGICSFAAILLRNKIADTKNEERF
jgi:hypothetical protein